MNETQWVNCCDPSQMLEFLRDKTSSRKLRLFGCAACRHVWHLLPKESRVAVETTEQYADGHATAEQLQAVRARAYHAWIDVTTSSIFGPIILAEERATCAAHMLTTETQDNSTLIHAVLEAAESAVDAAAFSQQTELCKACGIRANLPDPLWEAMRTIEKAKQCVLIRDVFGNPFQPVTIDPLAAAWNDDSIGKRAREIYSQRAFHQVPGLACMLEEAGYSRDVQRHCSRLGKHVLGCWLVDLLVGKE